MKAGAPVGAQPAARWNPRGSSSQRHKKIGVGSTIVGTYAS